MPSQYPSLDPDGERTDPETELPLPDPFSEYVPCPHCGEAEVEVWCYQAGGVCHIYGSWIVYPKPIFCGKAPYCTRGDLSEMDG